MLLPGFSGSARSCASGAFHDTSLGPHVKCAYHALSIDEQRLPFKPTLWTGTTLPGQILKQVWFAGAHTQVGGGSSDSSLSDIALLWIVQNAVEQGMALKAGQLQLAPRDDVANNIVSPDFAGTVINSRHGAWELIHSYHRLREISVDDAPGQSLASSVVRRLQDPALGYSPPGIEDYVKAGRPTSVVEESPTQTGDAGPAPDGPPTIVATS